MPGKSAGRVPCLSLHPGIRLATEKRGKNLSQVSRKVPVGHHSLCRHGHLLTRSPDKSADHGLARAVL
jgi:hypothetical protein